MTTDMALHFILNYVLPYGICMWTFFELMNALEDRYQKTDLDIIWKKSIKFALIIGAAGVGIAWLRNSVFPWIVAQFWWKYISQIFTVFKQAVHAFETVPVIADKLNWLTGFFGNLVHTWVPVYWQTFVVVYTIGAMIEFVALVWRVSFARTANVLISAFIKFPYLALGYLKGYQTPVYDYVLSGRLKAKLRENLNDAYDFAVQGMDEQGNKFENGMGGSVQTQKIKAVDVAFKRAKVTVSTTANGVRKARMFVRQSRETETDNAIESCLKGFGERVSGNAVYFPNDPIYSAKDKGFVFDSSVPYDSGNELGEWDAIFSDPFAEEVKIKNGGRGFAVAYMSIIMDVLRYFTKFTPVAIYQRMFNLAEMKFRTDRTAEKAKFKVQQNLDLSVLKEPVDRDTGNSVEMQRKIALETANRRIPDITQALQTLKISGQFNRVLVGGSTAIYEYTLPPDPNLPSDFKKIQESISNLLRIKKKPIVSLEAGCLKVSIDNGVNIPVSFADMIRKRKKGASCIVSGICGLDAMGKLIYFDLDDHNPHVMLFGKTGTGKTVLIMNILYSIMSATDPKHLRIAYADGKGNSFEFMSADSSNPNPFTYAPPGDASSDLEYSRALIRSMELETRRRIDLFKKAEVAKLAEYNEVMEKQGKEILPEILFVVDEFSAITQQDAMLKASEMEKLGTIKKFEYIAKMSRSVGIHLLCANQSARKSLVPGEFSANITARVSLGVSEPIESEIALPDSGIAVHLISQPGEFYSTLHGITNIEHGNCPYIPQDEMKKLNDSLCAKFGKPKYVMTRKDIMDTLGDAGSEEKIKQEAVNKLGVVKIPDPIPSTATPLDKITEMGEEYYPWLYQHPDVITSNRECISGKTEIRLQRTRKAKKFRAKLDAWYEVNVESKELAEQEKDVTSHSVRGQKISNIKFKADRVTHGRNQTKI
jgi:S-DNA-T family DNA segregation ATPase FtsK/SpoIIIE